MKHVNTYKEVIVKSVEEECYEAYWLIKVPVHVSEEGLKEKLEMAAKYSTISDCDEEEGYDEHFEEMLNFREQSNGEQTFNHYIKKVCGYDIEPLKIDFVYEW